MEQAILGKSTPEIPPDMICPITGQIMADPVMLVESGYTYEREAILKWLKAKPSDPLTNQPLTDATIAPNRAIKSLITSFLDKSKAKHPSMTYETYLPESWIESVLTAMQNPDLKGLMEALQKDPRLLTHPLSANKNLLVLACESAPIDLLAPIVDKLGARIPTLEAVKPDQGRALFLQVSRRLGVSGASVMAKALEWQASDWQKVLAEVVPTDAVALAEIVLSLGGVPTPDLLHAAYAQKQTAMVKVLWRANGSLMKQVDSQGNDWLRRTLVEGYPELTLFLLTEGGNACDPNLTHTTQPPVLHLAIEQNPIELRVVEALLSHPQLQLNQTNPQQETALHLATRRGCLPVVERLVKTGMGLNAKNHEGKTALAIAYEQYAPSDFAVLKCLIGAGAELNDLLLKAIAAHQLELIHFLLSESPAKVNPNITDYKESPALLRAIEADQPETVALLLRHPAINPSQTDPAGNTGLHRAAGLGNPAMVKLLMKHHLSIKAKNTDRKTPVQLAMERGFIELAHAMQTKHRGRQLKPFLKPLQLKLEEQSQINQGLKAEIEQQKQTNQAQALKIGQMEEQEKVHHEQMQSFTRENAQWREAFKQLEAQVNQQSTALAQLSIFSEKYAQSLMTVAEKAQRKQAQPRQRDREKGMKNPLQSQLVEACLKGELGLVKELESQSASLWYPNADGLYPLVAAVHGCSLEMVRYVESKLQAEAVKQWGEVDAEEAQVRIERNTPTPLGKGATYGDVADWYVKHQGSSWCAYYDAACLKHLHNDSWGVRIKNGDSVEQWSTVGDRWDKNGARVRWARGKGEKRWGFAEEYGCEYLQDAGKKIDRIVIQEIREQLDTLKHEVLTKTKHSFSLVGSSFQKT